jgi:hypothetical protein
MAAVIAQDIRYPTYEYYGQVLSADEFLKLVEAETPLHCTELPSVGRYLADLSAPVDFICFNTREELDTYIDRVIAPAWEQIARENPPPPSPQSHAEASALLHNHWALYANSVYTPPHLGDVHNGTTCQSTSSGVWSAWRDGSPNTLTLWRNTNCTGFPSFDVVGAPLPSCVWGWPLGCGGSQGASVP